MTVRRAFLFLFSSSVLLGLAWGCSAADGDFASIDGAGGGNGIGQAGSDGQVLKPDASVAQDGGVILNALCGKSPSCVPDAPPNTCSRYVPTVPNAGGSGGDSSSAEAGGAGGQFDQAGGASGSNEAGASGSVGRAGSPSESGAAGETIMSGGAAGEAGASSTPVTSPQEFGCQVQRTEDPDVVVAECGLVGSGGANAPCLTASDCQPGFACVGDQSSGLCQQYCCESGDTCKTGTYCAERPMRDAHVNALPMGSTDSNPLLIPVCVPAENCDLGAPYPCTAGTQCACKSGTACLVVRSDGTTTCAVPGMGKTGQACPCAWGHVCSAATNQCLKLCYTRGAASCGSGACQSASELPDGWGVCVGSSASSD